MKITRDNYEVYFLDYLEGNLDETLVNDFIDFLGQNPDLKAELDMAGTVKLEPEHISFGSKRKLYKEKFDLEQEFNRVAVARLEGDLQKNEKAEFENYLSKHPEKQKEATLFEKTRLKADESIVFKKKNKLYHYSTGKTILLWSTRIAAVFILGFLVYRAADLLLNPEILPENQVAVTEKKISEEPEKPTDIQEKPAQKAEPAPVEEKVEKPAKKVLPEAEPVKSLRETTKGQMDHERIAEARMPIEIPEKIPTRNASLSIQQTEVALAQMEIVLPETPVDVFEERLLADVVREKTAIGNLSLNKVAKAGLNLISNISKNNFNFETNEDGEITELNYDSRLLAFSIPTNSKPESGE